MSSRSVQLLTSDNKRNVIPVGRQLPRTPPSQNCVKQLDFPSEQPFLPAEQTHNEENQAPNTTFDSRTPPVKPDSSDDPQSMVKGMKGYQLTPADLEFMQTLKGEKELKKVQEDLKTVQNTLKGEMMVLELALASMEKAQTELKLLPPCEDIRQWSEVLLEMSVPSSDLSELDTKALLALVTQNDAKTAIQYKKAELKLMEQMVENRKNDAKKRVLLEKLIAVEQSKVLSLMSKLAELKSALQKKEVNKSLHTQVDGKTSLRSGKAKLKSENADSTSKRTTSQKQKSEPACAQKIRPDALRRDCSSPAPVDKSTTPSECRTKGRRKVAADQGKKGQRKEMQPGAPSDTPALEVNRSLHIQVDGKTSLRSGKTKLKSVNADSTSKRTTSQQQKSEQACAQKIRPDALRHDCSSPAPADKSNTPSECRTKGRREVAADRGEKGQRKGMPPGAPSDMPAFTYGRRKTPVLAPAEEQNLGLRRSRRIACRK